MSAKLYFQLFLKGLNFSSQGNYIWATVGMEFSLPWIELVYEDLQYSLLIFWTVAPSIDFVHKLYYICLLWLACITPSIEVWIWHWKEKKRSSVSFYVCTMRMQWYSYFRHYSAIWHWTPQPSYLRVSVGSFWKVGFFYLCKIFMVMEWWEE